MEQKAVFTHLERAIQIARGQGPLGAAMQPKYSQSAISLWRKALKGRKKFRLDADVAVAIEKATSGQVTRQQLRPDLYPE